MKILRTSSLGLNFTCLYEKDCSQKLKNFGMLE